MAMCASCGRQRPLGRRCACQASGGAGAAQGAGAGTVQVLDVPKLFRLPETEKLDATVRSVRSAAAVAADRPGWARALDAMGALPLIAVLVVAASIAIALKLVAAMLGRGRGRGGLSTLSSSLSITDRVRRGRTAPATVALLELATPSGPELARLAVDPAAVPLHPGDAVTLTIRGRVQGTLRATHVRSPSAGEIAAPPLVTARAVTGAAFDLFVLLSIAASAA